MRYLIRIKKIMVTDIRRYFIQIKISHG